MRTIQLTAEQKRLLAKMTNWQRHQWNRAHCPCDAKGFLRFAAVQARRAKLGL